MFKFNLTVLVTCIMMLAAIDSAESGQKEEKGGQSIIMNGHNLVMKDNDKKKKGDTIVINDGGEKCGCSCGSKKQSVPIPYPVMVPQKEVKYVHVPVHHGWGGGNGMMPGGFARADEELVDLAASRSLNIGEKFEDSLAFDYPGEPRLMEGSSNILPDEFGDYIL